MALIEELAGASLFAFVLLELLDGLLEELPQVAVSDTYRTQSLEDIDGGSVPNVVLNDVDRGAGVVGS